MNYLSRFGDMSAIKMNVEKSSLYTAGVHGKELEHILAYTSITKGSMHFPTQGSHL